MIGGAVLRAAVKAMDHIDIGTGNRIDRPCLVLAIFKFAFFVRAERISQQFADILPENIGSVQGE